VRTLRVYLDTSVIGGCFDDEFREESLKLFECIRVGIYRGLISTTTLAELSNAPSFVREVLDNFDDSQLERLPESDAVDDLATAYIDATALPPSCFDDATHIAYATISHADVLVSWNFKHIVNIVRITEFNAVNQKMGYGPIEIQSPKSLIYGKEEEGI
jgi:hypothetical protein